MSDQNPRQEQTPSSPNISSNPHKSHRERLRKRFLTDGIDKLEDHVKLELLLFYAIPQRDTNPIAHRLLERFGSISNVFDAPLEDLLKVEGIGQTSAVLLKMIPPLARVYIADKERDSIRLYSTKEIGKYLQQKYIGRSKEALSIVALDSKSRVVYCDVLLEGDIDAMPVYIKDVVSIAIRHNAAAIVMAHNHPSGNPMPSGEDLYTTWLVYRALDGIGVELRDHLVLTDNSFLSFRETGLMQKILQEYGAIDPDPMAYTESSEEEE
ncbi:MAG: DNA repair protein RadC [Oscillospiraceae bacterium]|nr:DNA repair protein RadC [Oscillospiraceae bacterium]